MALVRMTLSVAAMFLAATSTAIAQAPDATAPDTAAKLYVARCTGCHTIGRGALTGPDLSAACKWRDVDLEKAILRMQEKTGALSPDEIATLIVFLKDPLVNTRIAAEDARIAQQFAAKLLPPSVEAGERLFRGSALFSNGGMACIACHGVGAVDGGTLGPDLSGITSRLGETGLISACEKTPFKVMTAIYRDKAVSRQEALHLARWIASVDSAPPEERSAPLLPVAAGVGIVGLAALILGTRRTHPTSARASLSRRSRP